VKQRTCTDKAIFSEICLLGLFRKFSQAKMGVSWLSAVLKHVYLSCRSILQRLGRKGVCTGLGCSSSLGCTRLFWVVALKQGLPSPVHCRE
jgi:hypothetical protein